VNNNHSAKLPKIQNPNLDLMYIHHLSYRGLPVLSKKTSVKELNKHHGCLRIKLYPDHYLIWNLTRRQERIVTTWDPVPYPDPFTWLGPTGLASHTPSSSSVQKYVVVSRPGSIWTRLAWPSYSFHKRRTGIRSFTVFSPALLLEPFKPCWILSKSDQTFYLRPELFETPWRENKTNFAEPMSPEF
jgi:hypothetical protein